MTYKIYMTVELPGEYADKDTAMDAAVKALQDAVDVNDRDASASMWHRIGRGAAIEARVFDTDKAMHGGDHEFVVDIHDGAI